MKGLGRTLLAGLLMSSAVYAQEWQTYTYPDPGFAIQFPGVPDVQTTKFKNAVGITLPVTRYVVRQNGVQYILSVVNYSTTNADALSIIGETARAFSAKGRVDSSTGARVNGSSGRKMTVTESDGSRSDVAIFFVNNHLYTVVGRALPPNPTARSADTARFQGSLQFLVDNSGLRRFFGGGNGNSVNTASSAVTNDNSGENVVSARARGSSAGENPRTLGNERADAACAGKTAGDIVQLETPNGRIPATCILTARPNSPAASTADGSRDARTSSGQENAAPRN
jgi:hypothetical protein